MFNSTPYLAFKLVYDLFQSGYFLFKRFCQLLFIILSWIFKNLTDGKGFGAWACLPWFSFLTITERTLSSFLNINLGLFGHPWLFKVPISEKILYNTDFFLQNRHIFQHNFEPIPKLIEEMFSFKGNSLFKLFQTFRILLFYFNNRVFLIGSIFTQLFFLMMTLLQTLFHLVYLNT